MNLREALTKIGECCRSRTVAFYVAAGISHDPPSCLPLGGELAKAVSSGVLDCISPEECANLQQAIADLSLEEMCGIVQTALDVPTGLVDAMADALDHDGLLPNSNHFFMAAALRQGHVVVTTNYDRQIERAYELLYGSALPVSQICYDDATFNSLRHDILRMWGSSTRGTGWLLKLHGSFRISDRAAGLKDVSSSVMTTLQRVGKGLPPSAERTLRGVLESCPLVVLGYGGMDIDIVYPLMMSMGSSQPIWWVMHGTEEEMHSSSELEGETTAEESKLLRGESVDMRLVNVLRVLRERERTGSESWLIRHRTSAVLGSLAPDIGLHLDPSSGMKNPDPEYWERGLRSFGRVLSKTEKAIITGKLAQLAAIRRGSAKGSGSEKLYELSDSVYQSILDVADKQSRIRILQELGWNQYRRNPESPESADKAISLYGRAQSSSGSGTSPVLLALTALAHLRARRIQEALPIALEAWNALPASVRELATSDARAIPFEPCDPRLAGVDPLSVSFVLRRIAGALNGYVSDPGTLSTSIKLRHCWQTDKCEERLLQHARRLAETALALSKANGERREQIQAENFLGLICCKLGDGVAAVGAHTASRHVAEQFTWYPELAQATRNLGLAYEASGKLDDAVETLEATERHFENADRPNKKNELVATLWHKGRIRIKSGNPTGIDDIGNHLDGIKGTNMDNWHWRANDHCLLGIAYWDILADRSAAAAMFESMVRDYKPDDVAVNFAAQAYGVDNALANLVSAWERVSGDPSIGHTRLLSDLALLMRNVERLRQAELSMIQSLGLV